MATPSPGSWKQTALSVLAGAGAGYLLGVLSARLLWDQRGPAPGPPPAQQRNDRELTAAISGLTAEMSRLREALEQGVLEMKARPPPRVSSMSGFETAQEDDMETEEDGDTEDEFYDVTTPNNNGESGEEEEEEGEGEGEAEETERVLDELGKKTLESEEACNSIIQLARAALEERADDVGLLWRLSRALVHLSMLKQDDEEEKALLQQALEQSKHALDLDSSVWQSHQWYAIAVGSLSKFDGTQQKIQHGFEYKEHISTAISLNPKEPTLHYLLGRWCSEVAALSWIEKKAAAALFATPPESSYEEALQCCMKAEELLPEQWKANMLLVAKCHIQLGDVPLAVEWLHKAYNLPTITSEDRDSQGELEKLLAQHDSSE